jgi:hypothetical protein
VPIPLLSEAEVSEIIDIGSRDAQIEYPPDVRQSIARMARGVPYIVQLLGLHAGDRALRRGANTVNQQDLHGAIQQSVLEIDPRVAVLYESLTQGNEDAAMQRWLLAIATGEQDRFARFLVQEKAGKTIVAGQPMPPHEWRRLAESGAVRSCPSAGFGLYTFAEPMLPHYILLRAVGYGLPAAQPAQADALT